MSDDVFAALEKEIGARLFTITVQDAAAGVARRVYSSNPKAYPVSGTKPITGDRWSLQVLIEGEPFIANSAEEFADVFADHEQIVALGCHSAMNQPIRDGVDGEGEVLGTVNILDVEGYFDEVRVFVIQSLIGARQGALAAAMKAAQARLSAG